MLMTRLAFAAAVCGLLAGGADAHDCDTTAAKSPKKDIVSTALAAGQFKTLAAALDAGGLVDALRGEGPFTVFAPTDGAFAKLPEGTVKSLLKPENRDQLRAILTYHVVAGNLPGKAVMQRDGARTLNGQRIRFESERGVRVNGATVVKADIACSNGTIHVIDRVILPERRDAVEVASGAGTFRTLLAAAKAADLADTLAGKGPYTIFAPTDAAFAKLPAGTVESLLEPENKDQLVRILTYHVVPGRVYAADALKAGEATTLARLPVRIRAQDGGVFVQNAAITATDIEAKNGVIHVIDTVLLPPARQ